MTSLVLEHFGVPARARDSRALKLVRERAVDVLGGRTVWCVSALPGGRTAAEGLCECLQRPGAGAVIAGRLEISLAESFAQLAERLDAMLSGSEADAPGPAEREICADCMSRSEDAVREEVGKGDVVVLHDPLSALLAEAVREQGAHAVWRLRVRRTRGSTTAWTFMRPYTWGLDAYVGERSAPAPHGRVVRRTVAAIPSADVVAGTEIEASPDDAGHDAGWRSVLAEVAETDRSEVVGGILHPRPAVATR